MRFMHIKGLFLPETDTFSAAEVAQVAIPVFQLQDSAFK